MADTNELVSSEASNELLIILVPRRWNDRLNRPLVPDEPGHQWVTETG